MGGEPSGERGDSKATLNARKVGANRRGVGTQGPKAGTAFGPVGPGVGVGWAGRPVFVEWIAW